MTKVALFGDTGMVGQKIERILQHHEGAEIAYRQNSARQEGDLDSCELAVLATLVLLHDVQREHLIS